MALKASYPNPTKNTAELTCIGGVEAVGTLIDLMSIPAGKRQFPSLLAVLTNLLPQMKASDAALLTAQQRSNVCPCCKSI